MAHKDIVTVRVTGCSTQRGGPYQYPVIDLNSSSGFPASEAKQELVKTALEQCAVKGEEEREEMIGADVANTLSRVLDHLASHQEFNEYIPVVLGCCISAMARNLPAKPVKTSLLPGVYALMRHCSDEGTASVQASLDANTRTHFQSLVEDFKKQKCFL
ncbi:hypothetical protein GBAR_LOCUS11337 [Geodia barretti]|uniref:Nucleolar 27S pre-rRNA processing Urb2/Npa2 C-terminal domain-containing protein n=1 Tax=Geodia barretti TaxID=519541 RepID=A0AA35RYE1_GEOBA|nr:hypothetical protein GBAR_LOCUS11337 [Geodia barretti]